MFGLQIFLAAGLSLSSLCLAAPTDAACTREDLEAAVNDLLTAQTIGSSAAIKALSSSVTYTQNDKAGTISTGILATPLKIDHNRSEYDTTACATYSELIVADKAKPYVIGTQMRFTGGSITKVQTLVTTTGDWLFNVTGTLYWSSRENVRENQFLKTNVFAEPFIVFCMMSSNQILISLFSSGIQFQQTNKILAQSSKQQLTPTSTYSKTKPSLSHGELLAHVSKAVLTPEKGHPPTRAMLEFQAAKTSRIADMSSMRRLGLWMSS
jgi:hypothetical protein